ncbi:hypothetical protein GIB67_000187 [Kingdonia uniflora]|uniref:phospholipase D n=1 Tax=Kingdonia uniflora TaxID=39325 RepID=A0A7J7P9R6_9MAGN|nr:hypothetical protein GIB67_000187 [Kingdonia uniflora]
MQMMYETVYKALEEVGPKNTYTPQDYLNFFCLGNCEALNESGPSFVVPPLIGSTPHENSWRNRRFMIYVHLKGMIMDDEYVIIGSANINYCSMSGSRDTEVAMGAYQPWHTCKGTPSGPRGQVHGYRMSLWAEHIGGLEQCFTRPESLDCVRRVRQINEWNWSHYISKEIREIKGHLLKYPIEVGPMGRVRPLATFSTFPDVGGDVEGSFCGLQEDLTI